jgi:hypothetical protein
MTSIPTTPEGTDDSSSAYENEANASDHSVSASDFSGEAHTTSSVRYFVSDNCCTRRDSGWTILISRKLSGGCTRMGHTEAAYSIGASMGPPGYYHPLSIKHNNSIESDARISVFEKRSTKPRARPIWLRLALR